MPPVRAYPTGKLANARAARLDKSCGVDAQSKSIFEDECEVNIQQTKFSLLDHLRKTIRTSSQTPT